MKFICISKKFTSGLKYDVKSLKKHFESEFSCGINEVHGMYGRFSAVDNMKLLVWVILRCCHQLDCALPNDSKTLPRKQILPPHMPGGTEELDNNPQRRYPLPQLWFEPSSFNLTATTWRREKQQKTTIIKFYFVLFIKIRVYLNFTEASLRNYVSECDFSIYFF
jgi:hypothetical protein